MVEPRRGRRLRRVPGRRPPAPEGAMEDETTAVPAPARSTTDDTVALPNPGAPPARRYDDSVLATLQGQIDWYDAAAQRADRLFKGIKVVQIAAAALIPFFAGAGASGAWPGPWLVSALGVLLVVLEGI